MNEPIKHHYIPQFILRNFNFEGNITFWDKKKNKLEKRNSSSIFMVKNLYSDDKNHPTDPQIIEKKFSYLETEVAKIINEKILGKTEIKINRVENELLRKFLFLLSFRAEYRKQQYIDGAFDDSTKANLAPFVKDNDYVDLWLRENEEILDSNRYRDTYVNDKISKIIRNDLESHLLGYYMTFIEARGQDFILGDMYPTSEKYLITMEAGIHMHYFYPLTPNLLLVLNSIHYKKEYKNITPFNFFEFSRTKDQFVIQPKNIRKNEFKISDEDEYIYKVQKIYEDDVKYVNHLIINEASNSIAFANSDRIYNTIDSYENLDIANIKNDYSKLLEAIKK